MTIRRLPRPRGWTPAQATGVALSSALLAVFVAGLMVGIVADMVTSQTGLSRFDAGAAAWGVAHATPGTVWAFSAITQLGGSTWIVGLAALVALILARRRRRDAAAFLVTVVVGQSLLSNLIKLLVARERPPLPHLAASAGFSYPSGHTAAAAATYAAIALVFGANRPWPVRVALGAAAAGVTVAIATSRVFLGVHWLTDVVGGALLGLAWFGACAIAFGGRILRFGAPAERVHAQAEPDQVTAPEFER